MLGHSIRVIVIQMLCGRRIAIVKAGERLGSGTGTASRRYCNLFALCTVRFHTGNADTSRQTLQMLVCLATLSRNFDISWLALGFGAYSLAS